VKINGVQHHLWGAVELEGEVRDAIVSKHRDKKAALKLTRKLMKRYGRLERVVTDKLRSYGVALKDIGAEQRQVTDRWENNSAENSHQPFRRREREMLRFRCMRSLQKFASVNSFVHDLFKTERSLSTRPLTSGPATPLSPSGGSSARAKVRRTWRN